MPDQASIFNGSDGSQSQTDGTNTSGSNTQQSQSGDAIANLLGSIKNESGVQKYKTLEDALVALQHSQTYIPQLTAKLTERETELNTAKKEVERIAELERTLEALTRSNSGESNTSKPAITEEAIAEIVSKTLTRTQQAEVQRKNLNDVVSAMKQVHGDKAEAVFYDRAKELGMSVEEFNALAARTPKAVLEMVGVKATQQSNSGNNTSQSSVNSGAFAPNQQTFIGRNTKSTLIGATSQDLMAESAASRKMVDELHAQGKSVHDLSDPKVYFAQFKQ